MALKKASKKKSAKKAITKSAKAPVETITPAAGRSFESLLLQFDDDDDREDTPLEAAQDLIYDAWEEPSAKAAAALAKKALALSADCADAYNLLAERMAKSAEERIQLYRDAVAAGERVIGPQAFKEDVGHFWGLLETRPYMRARAGLADALWLVGERRESVDHHADLLRLNPGDNQGIRYVLLPRLIELGSTEAAEDLYRTFEGDAMATWLYSRALLDFRKDGASTVARKSLDEAMEFNPYVPAYLLGRKKLPRLPPDYYGIGDQNEAVIYAEGSMDVWKATPGALEWLAARIPGPKAVKRG